MIPKSNVAGLLNLIKINYRTNYTNEETLLLVDLWYDCLKNYDLEIIGKCIRELFLSSKYPPQIADVVELYNEKLAKIKNDEMLQMHRHREQNPDFYISADNIDELIAETKLKLLGVKK